MATPASNDQEEASIRVSSAIILAPVVAIIVLAVAIVIYIAILQLSVSSALSDIQQTLDQQCGPGIIIASADGYTTDPAPAWSSLAGRCTLDNGEWLCTCQGSP